MEIKLQATENMKKIVEEVLKSKGFQMNENADTLLIENNSIIPVKTGVAVIYNSSDLNSLMEFLDKLSERQENNSKKTIVGKIDEKFEIIPFEKILFFEGDGNYVYCRTLENRYKIKEKLYELSDIVDRKTFIRVSKSYIVNILNVGEIVPWFGGRLLLKFSGVKESIEVSRNYVREFKDFLGL